MKRIKLILLLFLLLLTSQANAIVGGGGSTKFSVTAITPAEGAKVKGIARYEIIKFSTSFNERVKCIQFEYVDATVGESLYTSLTTNGYDPSTKAWNIKNYSTQLSNFDKGHEIHFIIKAYNGTAPSNSELLGTAVIHWIGDGNPSYVYSPVEILNITPSQSSSIKDPTQNKFVITYSGPVVVNTDKSCIITGQKETADFESVTSNSDKTVWTFIISKSLLEATTPLLYFNVYVTDTDGLVLRGNSSGAENLKDLSYYKYKYICYLGSPNISVTPAAGEISSLSNFTLAYSGGLALSYTSKTPIEILDAYDRVVSTVPISSLKEVSRTAMSFNLSNPISTPGKYRLHIPEEIFALGTEANGYTSKDQIFEYTIPGKTYHPYDFNSDGLLNADDVAILADILLHPQSSLSKYDVNGDGTVTIEDVTQLIGYIKK